MFWLVTNLRDRTSGCASREEREEVQSGDDVAEMQALIQPSSCDGQSLQSEASEL